jgi:membrane protein
MIRDWALILWTLVKDTFGQWQGHRSAEMAAALAFYGALALAGLSLVAVYVAQRFFGHGAARGTAVGGAGHFAGPHNAHFLAKVLQDAASRPHGWVALAIGALFFLLGVLGIAFQIQRMLNAIWDVKPEEGAGSAREAKSHAPQFLAIFFLSFVLICLLFAGATLHALTSNTHHLALFSGLLYQALDIAVSIAVLTFVFLFIFAYLPPVDVPWRNVWIGSVIAAVLYERGQFALSVYFGQMDATSPYADAGVLLIVVLWLYYSAEVILIGAAITKVLKTGADDRVKKRRTNLSRAS